MNIWRERFSRVLSAYKTSKMRKPFICGNWKMYKTIPESIAFADEFKKIYSSGSCDMAICAPCTQLDTLVKCFKDSELSVGAQNCHFENEGAFTGEISVPMLKDIGVEYCIVGHSERRLYFNELDEDVNKKVKALFEFGITPIVCVGEDEFQREHNYQDPLVLEQVKNALSGITEEQASKIIVAYEPIWAIGTGRTATPIQAEHMCGVIRKAIREEFGAAASEQVRVIYGGSVKPENIKELMDKEEIDGALVGGASLKPLSFLNLVNYDLI